MKRFILFLFLFLFTPVAAFAEGEFHSKYRVRYVYDAAGKARVEQDITLTNQLSQVYATQYQLIVQGDAPKQISGHDSKGVLRIESIPLDGDKTQITVKFNDEVVGKGNSLNFMLAYEGEPAQHNGQVWEIILPKLGNTDNMDDYELSLVVPPSYGNPAFISPRPISSTGTTYTFTKEQMQKVGVVAAFGNFQTFDFNLTYNLENPEDKPVFTEVALPADTGYQRVFFDAIEPRPVSTTVDADGNWLARFDLEPKQSLKVVARGQAHLLAEPARIFSGQSITPLNSYLQPTAMWPVHDPIIQQLAKELKTPQAIYDYVVGKLDYDYSAIKPGDKRKGALGALASPLTSVCTEFTDLFIAIARAAGIPAREVNGYAYTTDSQIRPLSLVSDILHAWPQYWDAKQQMWINIDPTWGKTTGGVDYFTKLDFNHFAFVTHGISDREPYAAGLYKQEENTKDVKVNFSQYKDYPVEPLEVAWEKPLQIIPFLPSKSYIVIRNNQGQAVYDTDIEVVGQNIDLKLPVQDRLTILPPFSEHRQEIILAPTNIFDLSAKTLLVRVGEQNLTYNIGARLYLVWQIGVGFGITTGIIVLAIFATRAWSLHLQRRNPANSLRGQGQGPQK